jgi:tetratricopeptide (TPR) repeat protein
MQLEALGYMTGESSTAGETIPFRGSLPDPVSRLPVLAQVESARLALQTGDLETAAERVEQVLELEPRLVTVRSLQVQIYVRQGKLETALSLARELHAERPTSNTRTALGYLFLMQGELDEAARFFSEAIEADPYLESSWKGYLHILFIRGEILTLREQLDRARTLLPTSPAIQGMDGVVLAMTGQHQEAELALLSSLEAVPRQPFLHHGMGIIRKHQDRLDEAETYFLEELQVQPPALPSRKLLVEIYAAQKRYAEQLEQLEIIVDVEPPQILTAHSKAQVLYNLQRFDDAHEAITICRALGPSYPACAMLEANILKRLGREQEAKIAYEHALELRAQTESAGTEASLP